MGDGNIGTVRSAIRRAFPAFVFRGSITPVDGCPWSEELDDEIYLYEGLRDKSWIDVSDEFVRRHDGDLPLLTAEAFAAFLPAWMMSGLNDPSGKNPVLEFTVYSLAPPDSCGNDAVVQAALEKRWRDRVSLLNPDQLAVVITFAEFVAECELTSSLRSDALYAKNELAKLNLK
jgi:hypothetical protein